MVPFLLDFGAGAMTLSEEGFLREEFAFSSTSSVSARYGDFLFLGTYPPRLPQSRFRSS